MEHTELDQLSILRNIETRLERIESSQLAFAIERLDMAQLALDLRRQRDVAFPDKYFSDNAWDILLELYQADQAGQRMQVSLVGFDANISKTTAARYLDILMQDGLVYREDDPSDQRRSYVLLTPKAKNLMEGLFGRFQIAIIQQASAVGSIETEISEPAVHESNVS